MTNNKFGGAIWTTHALDRIKARKIPQEYAISTFKSPHHKEPSDKGGVRFKKKFGQHEVTLVANKNEQNDWVVVSIWMNPPMKGTEDEKKQKRYKEYKNASLGKKIWLTLLRQIGL